jgi:hypothetical protein
MATWVSDGDLQHMATEARTAAKAWLAQLGSSAGAIQGC